MVHHLVAIYSAQLIPRSTTTRQNNPYIFQQLLFVRRVDEDHLSSSYPLGMIDDLCDDLVLSEEELRIVDLTLSSINIETSGKADSRQPEDEDGCGG